MLHREVPRRVLLALLLCLLSAASSNAAQRLGTAVVPTFEAVDLRLDADTGYYTGSVLVSLNVREKTDTFGFHAEEMRLDKIVLRGKSGPVAVRQQSGERGLVTLSTEKPLALGGYTLEIEFSNDFGTRAVGLYRMVTEGQGYAFTQFEPDDAREAFPCWDEPEFKIPWQLTISVPEGHTAVTNTPVESEKVKDGQRKLVFAKTRPLPSYLVAIATGPLETVAIPGMSVPGRVFTVRGQIGLAQEAVKTAPPLLAALERYFGRPYPYEKLDLIAVPEFWPGAMENAGAITFADRILLVDSSNAGPEQRSGLVRVLAHEMAHMWFGDLVTMQWWDDLWLNESFADWMADKIAQEVFPEFQFDVSELGGIHDLMSTDARPSTPAIRQKVEGTENLLQEVGLAYSKGKAVLGMFESWMGAAAFRQGVRDYLSAHEWGNAVAEDLWSALSKAAGKEVGPPMATFLDQNGLPLLTLELRGNAELVLRQERFLNFGVKAEPRLWQIPVTLKYSDGASVQTENVLLTGPETVLQLKAVGPVAWVLPNAGERGYYRWKVPPAMLLEIARQAPRALELREKIGFLGNLSGLLDAGAVSGDEYLRVLRSFSEDPEPLVIRAVADALGSVKQAFVPEELEGLFALYVRGTLGPALEHIGRDPKAGEPAITSLLRPQLYAWLGVEGQDEKVLEHAAELAKAYRADRTAVAPELAEVAIGLAARRGDRAMFEDYKRRFETAQVPAERQIALHALASFRDPALMDEALRYTLSGPLRPNEVFSIPLGMGDSPKYQDLTFHWLLKNHAEIVKRIPPMAASFMPFSAGGCSAERLEEGKAFFSDAAHALPGTDKTLAKVVDQVQDCLALRQREGENVAKYLREQAATP